MPVLVRWGPGTGHWVEALEQGLLGGEVASGLDGAPTAAVQRLGRVRAADDDVDLDVICPPVSSSRPLPRPVNRRVGPETPLGPQFRARCGGGVDAAADSAAGDVYPLQADDQNC